MRVYPRVIVAVYCLVAIGFFGVGALGRFGKSLDYDFVTYWSASYLTLAGRPAAAFDLEANTAAQRLVVPSSTKIYPWHYPPTYQLLIAPLALLPYLPSYLAFASASLLAYVAALRRLLPWPDATWLLLAFPGAFACALHGQNSLLSAALFAVGIGSLRDRPLVAGICFGLLAYKPQLGILLPFALLAAGCWRTLAAGALTALGFAAAATAVLGAELWRDFIDHFPLVRAIMEQGLVPWAKMPTAFVFLRFLGASQSLAYAGQILSALLGATAVVLVWRRRGPSLLAGAVLVSATLIVSPYTFDYEAALLAIPLAILAADMARRGAARWEKLALLLLFAAPAFMSALAEATHLQVGYLVTLAALFLSGRRALAPAPRDNGGEQVSATA